jgi:hypothetical protein
MLVIFCGNVELPRYTNDLFELSSLSLHVVHVKAAIINIQQAYILHRATSIGLCCVHQKTMSPSFI